MISSPNPIRGSRSHRLIRAAMVFALTSTLISGGTSSAQAAAITAVFKKITTEVINADKVYIAYQFGVVQAAKAYEANMSLTTRLAYNQSFIKVFQAAITEYNYFLKNPKCYPTTPLAKVKQGIADNQKSISAIYADNVQGQVVGDPKKMTTYTPVGLLK